MSRLSRSSVSLRNSFVETELPLRDPPEPRFLAPPEPDRDTVETESDTISGSTVAGIAVVVLLDELPRLQPRILVKAHSTTRQKICPFIVSAQERQLIKNVVVGYFFFCDKYLFKTNHFYLHRRRKIVDTDDPHHGQEQIVVMSSIAEKPLTCGRN